MKEIEITEDDRPIVKMDYESNALLQDIDSKAFKFDQDNPEVYQVLRSIAFDLHINGVKKTSMKMIYEVARWQFVRQTKNSEFKLNNNFTPWYARKLMITEDYLPDGFFELREIASVKPKLRRPTQVKYEIR